MGSCFAEILKIRKISIYSIGEFHPSFSSPAISIGSRSVSKQSNRKDETFSIPFKRFFQENFSSFSFLLISAFQKQTSTEKRILFSTHWHGKWAKKKFSSELSRAVFGFVDLLRIENAEELEAQTRLLQSSYFILPLHSIMLWKRLAKFHRSFYFFRTKNPQFFLISILFLYLRRLLQCGWKAAVDCGMISKKESLLNAHRLCRQVKLKQQKNFLPQKVHFNLRTSQMQTLKCSSSAEAFEPSNKREEFPLKIHKRKHFVTSETVVKSSNEIYVPSLPAWELRSKREIYRMKIILQCETSGISTTSLNHPENAKGNFSLLSAWHEKVKSRQSNREETSKKSRNMLFTIP